MRQFSRIAFSVGLIFLASKLAFAGQPEPQKPNAARGDSDAVARRVWAITELVLEHHVKPPTRCDMLLDAMTTFLKAAKAPVPANLEERIAGLSMAEEFKALLQECWPNAEARQVQGVDAGNLESSLIAGLFRKVVGGGGTRQAHFVNAAEYKVQEQMNANRYVGTGIQVKMNGQYGLPQIVTAFPGGPARAGGAKAGDLIVEVDGVSLTDKGVAKAVELLRGEEGSTVTMVVRQPDSTETRIVKMVRSVVPFATIAGYQRLADDAWDFRVDSETPIAYVQIRSINVSTLHDLRMVELALQANNFRALVLDLRSASGENVYDAALLADGLLDGGVLWRIRDAKGKVKEYRAERGSLFRDWPMAVLVGPTTQGSGPELLAAALQDNRRAVLVGKPLRGDRYQRSYVSLPDAEGAVYLATGIAERASGPANWPVRPDHDVAMEQKLQMLWFEWRHLQELNQVPAGAKTPDDPQLAKAVDLLRAALQRPARTATAP